MVGIGFVNLDDDVGRAAVHVRQQRTLIRLAVHKLHGLARQIVQTVDVLVRRLDDQLTARILHPHNRLEQAARAILNELPDGVQVGGEIRCRRENALVVLALALGEQLLEPLAGHHQRRLVVHQNLDVLALAIEDVAQRGVLVGGVGVQRALLAAFARVRRALHHRGNVDACRRNRQKTHRRQHGEASADVIRHDEGLVALNIRQILQRTARLVGRGVNAALRALCAILFFQHLLEHAESNRGFGRRAGLGDNVDGEVTVADNLHHVIDIGRRNVVAHEVDFRDALFTHAVVHLPLAELNGRARAEVRAADADDNQHIAVALNFLRRLLDAGKLFLVVIHGKVEPAEEITARALAGQQFVIDCIQQGFHVRQFRRLHEAVHACGFQFHSHENIPLFLCQAAKGKDQMPLLRVLYSVLGEMASPFLFLMAQKQADAGVSLLRERRGGMKTDEVCDRPLDPFGPHLHSFGVLLLLFSFPDQHAGIA